ncbi:MAG: hypothetical protein M5U19_22695 [Microthrixaceae bacterium]|nr:hypothetical protein [Microthrixaceae bacterium]
MFGLFLESVGITLGDGTMTLPDGTTYTDGDECPAEGDEPAEPGRVALYQWPPQAGENTEPRVITSNIATTRFTEDGQTYVLAFAPRGRRSDSRLRTTASMSVKTPSRRSPRRRQPRRLPPPRLLARAPWLDAPGSTAAPGDAGNPATTAAPSTTAAPEAPGTTADGG